jgi:catalase
MIIFIHNPCSFLKKMMTNAEKQNTINNFVGVLKGLTGPGKKEIILNQLDNFYKADKKLSMKVAKGTGTKHR